MFLFKTVDLFSGCGGLSLGFQHAGFDVVAAFDHWEPAINVYNLNFDHKCYCVDLSVESNWAYIAMFKPEVIIGGPPCQDFSSAGKRTEGAKANLTRVFSHIVSSIKPLAFVMENVPRTKASEAYAEAKEVFIASGYGLTEMVLDASLCGVPQKRQRFFAIGVLNETHGFLERNLMDSLAERPMSVREYMGDELDVEHYYRHPRNYARRAIFSINEPSPTIRGVNREVPPGYPGHPRDSSPLLPHIRSLTTKERSRIQTFPPNFRFVGSKTSMEQMIGNAVPVELARYVATHLLSFLKGTRKKRGHQGHGEQQTDY